MKSDGEAMTFSAASDLEAFFNAAKYGLREVRVIEGVEVVITPEHVTLDASNLLNRVTAESQKVQQEIFGRV